MLVKHLPRTSALVAALAVVALAATACNANNNDSSPTASPTGFHQGGTLTIYSSSTEQSFDPATSQSLAITSQGLVHRRLTTWDIRARAGRRRSSRTSRPTPARRATAAASGPTR